MADRRQRADAMLVYGGMLAVTVLTLLAWRWSVRRGHHHGGQPTGGVGGGDGGQPSFAR